MQVQDTLIPEVKIVCPAIHYDSRGYFFESYNDKEFKEKVCNTTFVQDNQSCSLYGTMRGLHWQKAPYAQSKLVRVVKGIVVDYAVDIRVGSPTFGQYVAVILSEDNNSQLFIPRGFAHGFLVLTNEAVFQYKCDNLYNKDSEAGMSWNSIPNWNDAAVVDSRTKAKKLIDLSDIILSDKDAARLELKDIDPSELFDYNINYYEQN